MWNPSATKCSGRSEPASPLFTAEPYRGDWKTQRIVESLHKRAIEVCLDIANHVIADRGLRVPATYAEAFEVLSDAGLLDPPQRVAMIRMSGFRNVIVHE